MSIMPPGGWSTLPPDNTKFTGAAPQSGSKSRGFLICKICDAGTLQRKSVYRMSGPAVIIGYILLIPSILGIAFSALLLLGILSFPANNFNAKSPAQTAFDRNFRQSCSRQFKASRTAIGLPATQSIAEQFCECSLSEFKTTQLASQAAQTCIERAQNEGLPSPTLEIDELYSNRVKATPPNEALLGFFRLVGSVSAITMGVFSFVGGLLGWLLVMKKRILQCDTCEAAVSAS
jgi:hypothetical protein